ncbi:MAG: TetR/AcrR family transcriptional regulator [Segniliparus sp.]|uniref:TetR/AcrR family transcriptional regulator n=1 Tax=Segniliparus sp. TaxID=2804064 RepID=UPI003F406DEB
MSTKESSRDRMLQGAVDLIRERGVAGVTVDAIVSRSNAPRGSVYYHFPEGRAQIVREAITGAGELSNELIRASLGSAADSREAISLMMAFWKHVLVDGDFQIGCPFVAATVDGFSADPELRQPVAEHFRVWEESMAEVLVRSGREPAAARRKASLMVAAFSGAVLVCRAKRSLEPLDAVAEELDELLA